MPSVSKKQHNFMEAVAHNSKFAKRVGIPQSVGQDFHKADMKKKTRKFADGGNTAYPTLTPPIMRGGAAPQGMSMGYKKGGHVKRKFSKGGDMDTEVTKYFAKKGEKALATHEKRESEGKEKDTKAIAKKEEQVLKGAPKALRNYEKKEHKDMGFKKGGKIKKFVKPTVKAKMDPALAAQLATPEPSMPPDQGSPMDAGMPPSMGGDMPGMKKGGRIKKHFDEGGDLKVAMDRRNALYGGRPAMGRTPVVPPAGRPVIGPRIPQTEQNMSRLSAVANAKKGGSVPKGIERKGSTSAKKVKMAHGGHVSSASRRADGCATKGKTRA